jgi:hypothetical protein
VPQRRRRLDPDTGRYRRQSRNQKDVNTAHARQRDPGERANAQLKSWKIWRKIRSSPSRANILVRAVQTLIIAAEPGWRAGVVVGWVAGGIAAAVLTAARGWRDR